MKRIWDGLRQAAEWLVIYAFLQNAITLMLYPLPYDAVGPVAELVASTGSVYFVIAIYLVVSVLLLASKLLRWKRAHKHTLFWAYIIIVYVTILEFVLTASGLALIDNALLFIGCGYAWLRWKFQTEYLDAYTLNKEAEKIAHERN